MARTVHLISYLPEFLQEYREMQHIMSAEDPELQHLFNKTEEIKNNQFIVSCDAEGIIRFEKMLGIVPNESELLEDRISRVLNKWNDIVPYTYKVLLNKLTAICGLGGYGVNLDSAKYTVDVVVHIESDEKLEEVRELLKDMIPANLIVKVSKSLLRSISAENYSGSTIKTEKYRTIN